MEMIDREKVIKALECCVEKLDTVTDKTHGFNCTACPYFKRCDSSGYLIGLPLMKDALLMLKAQEPRVMTPADVNNIGPEDVCAFIEIREETHMYACYMRQYDETHTEIMCDVLDMPTKLQNGCARLWTSRPDEKRRAETPWEI